MRCSIPLPRQTLESHAATCIAIEVRAIEPHFFGQIRPQRRHARSTARDGGESELAGTFGSITKSGADRPARPRTPGRPTGRLARGQVIRPAGARRAASVSIASMTQSAWTTFGASHQADLAVDQRRPAATDRLEALASASRSTASMRCWLVRRRSPRWAGTCTRPGPRRAPAAPGVPPRPSRPRTRFSKHRKTGRFFEGDVGPDAAHVGGADVEERAGSIRRLHGASSAMPPWLTCQRVMESASDNAPSAVSAPKCHRPPSASIIARISSGGRKSQRRLPSTSRSRGP